MLSFVMMNQPTPQLVFDTKTQFVMVGVDRLKKLNAFFVYRCQRNASCAEKHICFSTPSLWLVSRGGTDNVS